MESHYCRANSNKIYLEPVFRSFADLNEQYKIYIIRLNSVFTTIQFITRKHKRRNVTCGLSVMEI